MLEIEWEDWGGGDLKRTEEMEMISQEVKQWMDPGTMAWLPGSPEAPVGDAVTYLMKLGSKIMCFSPTSSTYTIDQEVDIIRFVI